MIENYKEKTEWKWNKRKERKNNTKIVQDKRISNTELKVKSREAAECMCVERGWERETENEGERRPIKNACVFVVWGKHRLYIRKEKNII